MTSVAIGRKGSEHEQKRKLFIQYLAAMKCDPQTGERVSMAEFAEKLKVDPKTLYVWQKLPDHAELVADATDDQLLRDLPQAAAIIRKHALAGSYNHLKLWYLQADRLKAEKQEVEHSGTVSIVTVGYGSKQPIIEGEVVNADQSIDAGQA